ncbi:MAG: hypothetical protein WBG75_07720, partial [Mycolicibacter algericus]
MGGPVCAGGVVALTSGEAAPVAGAAGAADAAVLAGAGVPCGPAAADLTTLAGPVPMGLPGPVPPVPIAPIPVLPGAPPPVPFVAPGPAGAMSGAGV